jgi:ABC-type microcin C transport system duplicated ATPase subunit YejF
MGMACSCQPGLIIAVEPTTALDVTIQAQVRALLVDMDCVAVKLLRELAACMRPSSADDHYP